MVSDVFLKVKSGQPMKGQPYVNLIKDFGIEGDANADEYSPRQVLLVSKQTLDKYGLNPGDFKENITTTDFDLNNLSSGTVIQIGKEVQLRICFTCEPCSYIGSLGIKNPHQTLGERGMLATILKSGTVRRGDPIQTVSVGQYSAVPFKVSKRFCWVVSQIPTGKITNYDYLRRFIGCSKSYLRAFPAYIKACKQTAPVHRVVNTGYELIEKHIPQQRSLLLAEGIEILHGMINDPQVSQWLPQHLYNG